MYPREVYLSPERDDALKSFLDLELINHYMERDDFVNRLIRYQKEYWAEPKSKIKTFPFTGAASIVIPLTAIAVEAIHSRTMTTLFGLEDQIVTVKAKNKDWSDYATPFERFLNHELLDIIDIYKPLNDINLEITKLGTGVSKCSYERVVRTGVRERNGVEETFEVTVKDGASVYAVPLGKFLMRFDEHNVETSQWCGEEHNDTIDDIEKKEKAGMFRKGTADKLWAWVTRSVAGTVGVERKTQRAQELLEGRTPVWPKYIDWNEIWLNFDVIGEDGSNQQREIVVCYHRGARIFMSIRNNWHHDLRRPYDTEVYFPVEHRWTGIGICKQNEQFQQEVTTQHRQRLDNATIANMRMIKINKSAGYGPGEPISVGKIWLVDNKDDVEAFQMGEIYNSAFQNEQATVIYSQQRTGVNEVTMGMPQVGTPGTATGDLTRLQEGNKKFDYAYKNVKRLTNRIILKTSLNIQQFGPRDLQYFEQTDGGDMVQHVLTLPPQQLSDGLLLNIKAIGQQQNKIIDRQNWVTMAPMLQQYITGMLQLSQEAGIPQLAQHIAMKGLQGGTEVMKQILESYDVRNIDKVLLLELLDMQKKLTQPPQAGNNVPSNPGSGGSAPPTGSNTLPALSNAPQLPSPSSTTNIASTGPIQIGQRSSGIPLGV
jgi:hypothetical protein